MIDEPTLADRLRALLPVEDESFVPYKLWETVEEAADRIAELEAKVRRYEAMEPCGGNCDLAWRRR